LACLILLRILGTELRLQFLELEWRLLRFECMIIGRLVLTQLCLPFLLGVNFSPRPGCTFFIVFKFPVNHVLEEVFVPFFFLLGVEILLLLVVLWLVLFVFRRWFVLVLYLQLVVPAAVHQWLYLVDRHNGLYLIKHLWILARSQILTLRFRLRRLFLLFIFHLLQVHLILVEFK
jgi:hypothetical protein